MATLLLFHMLNRVSPAEKDALQASLEAWPPLWQMILVALALSATARLLGARL